ncbi:TYMP [Cordylochernes scorpioides]|uniref:TYMP n=1 Tax=Cordylochernes scorpioides TaxID=51811 RepID=A0ABY6LIV5_9ARAC|nr:TYMP [Cordylochernes scorpioides]
MVKGGVATSAFITNMDEVLGHCVGDSLEMWESLQCLKGTGPSDLMELTLNFAGELLRLVKLVANRREGVQLAEKVVKSGAALDAARKLLSQQGASVETVDLLCSGEEFFFTENSFEVAHDGPPGDLHWIDLVNYCTTETFEFTTEKFDLPCLNYPF